MVSNTKFSEGQKAEAVDSVGCWAKCTVTEVRENGAAYVVRFDGWSSKWDLEVATEDIRPFIEKPHTCRRQEKAISITSFHLERGDVIEVISADGTQSAEVRTVDPLNNCVEVLMKGEKCMLGPEEIAQKRETPDSAPRPKRPKVKNVQNKDASSCVTSVACQTSIHSVEIPSMGQMSPETNCLLPSAPGANSFLRVGDICLFQNSLTVVITSIVFADSNFFANCAICEIVDGFVIGIVEDSLLKCLTTHLSLSITKPNSKFSKTITNMVSNMAQLIASSSRVHLSDVSYQKALRKVTIGRQLWSDIQSMLGSKSFKRSFDYIVNTFDYELFGLTASNYSLTYLAEDGFSVLDNVLCSKWDVQATSDDHTSKFYFIRSVCVKASLLSLRFIVIKAQSTVPLTEKYREEVVKMLQQVQSENGLNSTASNLL